MLLSLPAVLGLGGVAGFVATVVLGELGFVAVGVGFLMATDRGLGFLDLSVPDARTVAAALVGVTAVLFLFRTAVVGAASLVGVPLAPSSVFGTDVDPLTVLLLLIPLSVLVVGPCKELLFRGVIQRYLGESLSVRGAGVLFALVATVSDTETRVDGEQPLRVTTEIRLQSRPLTVTFDENAGVHHVSTPEPE